MNCRGWIYAGVFLSAWGCASGAASDTPYTAEAASCRSVLADLSRRSGEELRAAPELAEDKLTLSVSSTPHPYLKASIAAILDAEWVRDHDGQLLLQPTARRRQALREADERKSARRRMVARQLWSWIDQERGPRHRGSGHFYHYPPEGYRLVKELPRDLVDQAILHPNPAPVGNSVDKMPGLSLRASQLSPAGQAAFKELIQGIVADAATRRTPSPYAQGLPARSNELVLELRSNELTPTSGGGLYLRARDPGRDDFGMEIALAEAAGAWGEIARNAPAPDQAPEPEGDPDPRELAPVTLPTGTFRCDRALKLLSDRLGADLVSDYFTRKKLVTWSGGTRQLRQVLAELDRELGVRHSWSGPTLLVRTRNWAELVSQEPSAAVVRRIEGARANPQGPAFADVLFAASRCTDEQLAVLSFHTDPLGKRLPAELVPRIRVNAPWLRAYAALTPNDLKKARSNAGLNLAGLPPQSRATWEKALSRSSVYYPPASTVSLQTRGADAATAYESWKSVPKVRLQSSARASALDLWQSVSLY